MTLTREQERELARLAKTPKGGPAWSPGLPPSDEVDEGARTIAISRSDRAALANSGPKRSVPRGPMKWGDREDDDPLTRTQKSPASPGLTTSTQRSSPSPALTSTQRTPSAAYANVPPLPKIEVQRPQMRSPSPRPEGASRSLWVPAILIVILALGAVAAWMWAMKIGPFAGSGDDLPSTSSSQTVEPPPVAGPEAAVANTEGTDTGSSENAGAGTETASGSGTTLDDDDGGTTSAVEAADEPPKRRRAKKKRRRPTPPPEDDDPPPNGEVPGIKPGRPVPP